MDENATQPVTLTPAELDIIAAQIALAFAATIMQGQEGKR